MKENNLVEIQNEQVVTNSRKVAEVFGKRPDHVMRDIDNIKKDAPNFGEMFFEAEAPDSYGRPQRIYYLNRDGLSLLVMGFTGKKAMEWKLKYIEAFNEMEKQLKVVSMDSYMIDDPIARAERWIEEQKAARRTAQELSAAQNYIEEVQPDVDFAQAVQQAEDWMDMGAAAKTLAVRGYGRNNLIKMMIRRNIAYRQGKSVLPMQKYVESGYFKIVEYAFTDYNDVDRICRKIAVSQRGLNFLNRQIRNDIDELAAEEDIA